MRQAKPDDVLLFVRLADIIELWPRLERFLGRSELRDLEDVRALLDAGSDLLRALADAPRKEAGFSPVTLAWVLEQMPIAAMGRALGRAADETRGLEAFRQKLVGEILAATKPD